MWIALLLAANAAEPQFSAGSYGRVAVASDLEGGRAESFNVASHGPRLEKDPYLELDLGWTVALEEGAVFAVLITPAISGDLFHYDGDFNDAMALRNLYVEARDFAPTALSVWAGARMYRGDDVYLLDFWPLDDQNTWGSGVKWSPGQTEVSAHIGLNRLSTNDLQIQYLTVETPGGVSGQDILVLDRQRTVKTLRIGQKVPVGDVTFRARVYGEVHNLPEGQQAVEDPFQPPTFTQLPSDRGSLIGAQLSAWGWAPQSFVHIWARRTTGLAAWDELVLPVQGLDPELRAAEARAWQLALAGNQESKWLGVSWGTYFSGFSDADNQDFDFDDRSEWVGAVRPQVWFTEAVALGVEASRQEVRPAGPNPRSGDLVRPSVTKFSVLPAVQAGRGGFSRPRIHLMYTATWLDDDARGLYDPRDVRVHDGVQHFMGVGAEWWLNSRRVIVPNAN
ncbi:MAG: hypothetical protein GWP91_25170 [Rhodobacterales bacterium]|nr:hypothetical protein [Rhodobacterales bacterium]